MRRGWRLAAAVALLGAVGLGACGDGGDGASSRSSDASASKSASLRTGGADAAALAEASAPVAERQITYTASLVVRVADAERASARSTAIAESADGYLAGQEADLEGQRQSTVTLRVPAGAFRQVLEDVARLGTVQDQQIDSDDVTDKVVDLRGRLKSQEASATRLRALLASAGTTADLVSIEHELAQRESEIESLEGKLRVLDDQVALASITARFTEKDESTASPGVLDALSAGVGTLLAFAWGIVVVGAFLLPFVPLLILAWALHRRWRRSHPRRVATPVGRWPATPPPPYAAPVGATVPGAAAPPPPANPEPGPPGAHPDAT